MILLNNYRPISILPAISKFFERAMYIRLSEFLENNCLFDSEQHGFRPGKSVFTAGVDLIEQILKRIDEGEHVIGIFMDLCRAFDSVSHSTLIKILSDLGIQGLSLKWFQSYLSNRQQYVEMTHTVNNKCIHRTQSKL